MGESAKRYPAPIEDLPKRGGELRGWAASLAKVHVGDFMLIGSTRAIKA